MRHRKKIKPTREQKRIISFGIENGRIVHRQPLVVSAGAGTGKTETIAAFVARRVEIGIKPERMLVLAFNREAAGNLRDRANGALRRISGRTSRLLCSTFHAAGLRFIRRFSVHLEMNTKFTLLDDDGARLLMQKAIQRRHADLDVAACRQAYSLWKGSLRPLKSALQERWPGHLSKSRELLRVFRQYDAAKRTCHVIDFDDMLVLWDRMLADENIRREIQSDFDYVIVDEYQDTNALQERILNRLCRSGRGLVVVGDDYQCICGYRGVEHGAVRRRGKVSALLSLTRNFRASQPLLDACNALIAVPDGAMTKQLWSKRTRGPKPELMEVGSEAMQARFVVARIEQAVNDGLPLREQAVLARTMEELHTLTGELDRHEIPYRTAGGVSFFETPEIASAIALLKWIENPADRIAAERALNLCVGLRAKDKAAILASPKQNAAWKQFARCSAEWPVDQWKRFKKMMKAICRGSWTDQMTSLALWFKEKEEQISRTMARRFVRFARTFNSRAELLDAVSLDYVAQVPRHDNGERLTLSTIHSAKGKEWTSVYLINAVDGCLPIQHAISAKAVTEERRVMFVGLTRARRNLILVMPRRLRQLGRARVVLARTPFVPARLLDLYSVRTECRR